MDFKKGHTGDSVYFQIDVPYDVCTGKDKSKNRIVEMHNHLKTLDRKVNITYKSWGSEKIADYFYIQEVQVNKRKFLRQTIVLKHLPLYLACTNRATGHLFVQSELLFSDDVVKNMQPGKKESQTCTYSF